MKDLDLRISREDARASASEPAALRVLEYPKRLRIPLGTHDSAEAIAVKPIGTVVAKGEVLTQAIPQAAHAALAPTSGRIGETSHAMLLNGRSVRAVDFYPDFEDRSLPSQPPDAAHAHEQAEMLDSMHHIDQADLGMWIDRLRGAGIWADRLGSPDLIAQLNQSLSRPIDTVICSFLDADRELQFNSLLGSRFAAEVMAGADLLAELSGARRIWMIVESGLPHQWLMPIRRMGRQKEPGDSDQSKLRIISLANQYPQADPTLLLYTLLNRRLRPGRLPVEQGVLLLDAAAAISIGRVIRRRQPMLQSPLAVRDHGRRQSHYLVVPIGISLRDVLSQLDVPADEAMLRGGDMLRDLRLPLDAIVGGGELTVHVTFHEPPINPDPCIRCSWCYEACPTKVQPAGVLEAAQRDDRLLAEHYGLEACIECGICSYVCPSRLPLLEGIRKFRHSERRDLSQ